MTTLFRLTIGINPAQRNQYLFSDHYLDTLLADDCSEPLRLGGRALVVSPNAVPGIW
jgi:hypothetical protein